MTILNSTGTTAYDIATNGHGPPYWALPSKVILSVTVLVIMVASLIGNGMVILVVLLNKRMKTRTNVFIMSMAVADFGITAICMPFSLITVVQGDWIFSTILCYFDAFANAFFFIASLHSLMYIAIFKYFCILHPLRHVITRRRAVLMAVVIWITALLCAVGPLFGWTRNEYKPGATQCGPAYPQTIKQKSHAICIATIGYVVPLLTMLFCYSRMFSAIHKHSRRLQQNTSMTPVAISKTQKRTTMTMFIIMAAFLLCWTPYFVYAIWAISRDYHSIPLWFNSFAYWFGYANSAMSPIVYAWRYDTYRVAFKKLLFCQKGLLLASGSTPMTGSPVSSRKSSLVMTPQLVAHFSKLTSITASADNSSHGSPSVNLKKIQLPPLPDLPTTNGLHHSCTANGKSATRGMGVTLHVENLDRA
ncbi:histamine H2 receptor-like [Ptychodera flava]|uniref:histamine H2 receptor-like n=1 Tax=Ptychodera flava TaxID=63121 RepID=UPI003969CE40